MYFINKEDIEYYRYAIAKNCFIKLYPEYKLKENIIKSNCMIMQKDASEEQLIVSLFKEPILDLNRNNKIIAFYQRIHYERKMKNNENDNVSILAFNKEFDKQYKEEFEKAIKTPEKYMESIDVEMRSLFKGILVSHNDASDYNGFRYKYYCKETVEQNNYGIVDGNISFVDPNTFNDPFDVNCFFANNIDIRDRFRIFCVAPTQTEILMWSYYGSEHTGYCFEYKEKDILDAILGFNLDGICIIGDVEYSDSRPKQKSKINSISITEINFYIQAAFTKFSEWRHEKEYRYVILSDAFSGSSTRYYSVNIPINNIYCGCKSKNTFVKSSKGNTVKVDNLYKDNDKYKLI